MMSTPLQHFSTSFKPLPTSPLSARRDQFASPYISASSGLDTLAEGSQFALQQLQNARRTSNSHLVAPEKALAARNAMYGQNAQKSPAVARGGVSVSGPSRGIKKNANAPVRRRISRACDQCNQLRTKCDGKTPCAHCVEFGLSCEYARERKKRGKASKKDRERAAAVATHTNADGSVTSPRDEHGQAMSESPGPQSSDGDSPPRTLHEGDEVYSGGGDRTAPVMMDTNRPLLRHDEGGPAHGLDPNQVHIKPDLNGAPNGYGQGYGVDRYNGIPNMPQMVHNSNTTQPPHNLIPPQPYNSYPEPSFNHALAPPPEHQNTVLGSLRFGTNSPTPSTFLGLNLGTSGSPGWLSLPSPSATTFPPPMPTRPHSTLRYPVLLPLVPHISSIIPLSLACDLLDFYFSNTSSSFRYPESPYVTCSLFRKRLFLHATHPRACSPALLASMLWVASQTSDAPFLTSSPSSRGRVCQKLLEITVGLLKPLIHGPASGEASPNYAANMVINGVALGGFGVSMDQLGAESGATGTLDDIATYIHLATVVSASEYKAASLRWWNVAWSMARELKLGRELPPNGPSETEMNEDGEAGLAAQQAFASGNFTTPPVSEETREERRRIWWLLFMMDRHLALCYNRPLFLLDKECEGLLQPMSDPQFEAGDFFNRDHHQSGTAPQERLRGPSFECVSHSTYGWFAPLMTILGGIVDLYHARNHPRLGLVFRNSGEGDTQVAEITRQLQVYDTSLREFEAKWGRDPDQGLDTTMQQGGLDAATPSVRSVGSSASRRMETISQTKMIVAYANHIMHVLHILLAGKWDPISLLDDNDLWISSQSFVTTTQHAVDAAEAAADILEHDPELSVLPYFFGIYLLQGSFLLLLIADKLQGDASPNVVKACETIVRAHEACVVTLNTEYQRNFRKVMRSALSQIRGRISEDFGEEQQRRREVLSLYRWTDDGTGLAL